MIVYLFQVRMSVFLTYMHAVSIKASILIILFYVLSNVASMCSNLWLSAWSMDSILTMQNNYTGNYTGNNTILPAGNSTTLRLGTYAALGLLQGNIKQSDKLLNLLSVSFFQIIAKIL